MSQPSLKTLKLHVYNFKLLYILQHVSNVSKTTFFHYWLLNFSQEVEYKYVNTFGTRISTQQQTVTKRIIWHSGEKNSRVTAVFSFKNNFSEAF